MAGDAPSPLCLEVLALLKERRNVLLSGPPATGKSRLLAEVAAAFAPSPPAPVPAAVPKLQHTGPVAIPARPKPPAPLPDALRQALPAPDRTNRKVFRTALHQASRHRDFLTGIVPDVRGTADAGRFRVVEGTLYRASEHAKKPDGASLVIIDEINRGPAVQVFGGAIVAMEGEKRLAEDNTPRVETQSFDLLDPRTGEFVEYAFPRHLYILAAMNQADVSVEPLDVAFLRRWALQSLEPDEAVLRAHLGLATTPAEPPDAPVEAAHVYEAAVRAWSKVNDRIALGRGLDFRIGHGVVMAAEGEPPSDLDGALRHAAKAWRAVRAHVDEAFFGDVRGVAAVLNADSGVAGHPYSLDDADFGGMPRQILVGPREVGPAHIYSLLRAVAAD